MSLEWGYLDENGPATWATKFPLAAGARQSPVNIDTSLVTSDCSLSDTPLTWKFGDNHAYRVVNTGYGWRVDVDGQGTELTGGPLSGVYILEQFHCHWGSTSDQGSEHTVDGKSYAAELHLVHWNRDKYEKFSEAMSHSDGLAVLAVFLEIGNNKQELEGLKQIISLIPQVTHKGESAEINFKVNLHNLLPKSQNYWTYLGSLTTPPCNESVIWIVFKEPIHITEEQLNVFREMRTVSSEEIKESEQCLLKRNFRPPLPLGNRVLRECGSI